MEWSKKSDFSIAEVINDRISSERDFQERLYEILHRERFNWPSELIVHFPNCTYVPTPKSMTIEVGWTVLVELTPICSEVGSNSLWIKFNLNWKFLSWK